MAGLYPLSNIQQMDANGRLLSGAKLYLFEGGTSTPISGYTDLGLSSSHPNPIEADSSGRLPVIFLDDGFYRQRMTDSLGNPIFDDDGIPVLSSGGGGSGTSVNPDRLFKTRDLKIRWDDQPLSGYVRVNGRTIGSASSGATERANADTQSLYEELWPYANIVVAAGKGASAAADFAANKPLTLPNFAGRGIFAMDDMGAGPQGILTAATIAAPTVLGSFGGNAQGTLAQANLPVASFVGAALTVTASGTTGIESAGHTHNYSGTTGNMSAHATDHAHAYQRPPGGTHSAVIGGGFTALDGPVTGDAGVTADIEHTHSYSGTTTGTSVTHTHTVTVNGTTSTQSVSSGGSGTAFSRLPPIMLVMIYISL